MGAIISPCGAYRYALSRDCGRPVSAPKSMLFILLNPSTADATTNDPTIRRCIGFAIREGCTEFTVVNLFALRATNPAALGHHPDPVGPENDQVLKEAVEAHRGAGSLIVAAWGSHPMSKTRALAVAEKFGPFLCLGQTSDGSPRHPLYVRADAVLKEWNFERSTA